MRADLPRSPRHAACNAGLVKHEHIFLRPDPSRTVIRPFAPAYPDDFQSGQSRVQQIAERVMELGAEDLDIELTRVKASLDERHRDVDDLLLKRYSEAAASLMIDRTVADDQQTLIGAYLSEEYAFEAAALFNPSVVLDPGRQLKRWAPSDSSCRSGESERAIFRRSRSGPAYDSRQERSSSILRVRPLFLPSFNCQKELTAR